jgi:hypothetical protein
MPRVWARLAAGAGRFEKRCTDKPAVITQLGPNYFDGLGGNLERHTFGVIGCYIKQEIDPVDNAPSQYDTFGVPQIHQGR